MIDLIGFRTRGNENAASIIPSNRCGQKLEFGWTAAELLSLQAAQKGRPARPQARQNRRRTLWGTLRILSNREQSWRPFGAAC